MVSLDPHVTAVKTLLDTTGRTVYVSRAASGPLTSLSAGGLGYIVFEPAQGVASATSFEGSSDQRHVRFVTRYFGAGWEAVDELRTLAKTVLLDVRPAVTGRSSERINHETEFPMDRDEDMPDVVIFSGDSWTFCTWPS